MAERPRRLRHHDFLASVLEPSSPLPEETVLWCEECGRSFQDQEALQAHMQTLHQPADTLASDRRYPCTFCGKSFHYQLNVKKHMFLVHPGCRVKPPGKENQETGEEEMEEQEKNVKTEHDQGVGGPENFKCKICGDKCKTKRALLAHIQIHYGGGYKCDFPGCDSVFKENAKLTRHKLVHTGVIIIIIGQSYIISICHNNIIIISKSNITIS